MHKFGSLIVEFELAEIFFNCQLLRQHVTDAAIAFQKKSLKKMTIERTGMMDGSRSHVSWNLFGKNAERDCSWF